MNYPYDDDYMRYDYNTHRYVLTEKDVLDNLNINLSEVLDVTGSANRQSMVNKFLRYISNLVYREIYKVNMQKFIIEYILAKCPSAREQLKQAMEEQIEYFMFNGDISVYSGVDFKKNTIAPQTSDRVLAPNARDILTQPLLETKVPILYAGKYNMLFEPKYKEENY